MSYYGNKYQRNWRPISIADATRYSVSWSRRNEALDRLDDLTFEHQKTAAESALGRRIQEAELKTRPQRGPLHTQYPAFPSARACLGLSAIAEFNAQAGKTNGLLRAAVRLAPQVLDGLDPNAVDQTCNFVVEAVANRLCVDQLYRLEGLGAVESYRLFAAAMIDLRFTRLKDVILAAATLGDLISGLIKRQQMARRLHPLTCQILAALAPACRKYQEAVVGCSPEELPGLGASLAREMIHALVPFLPLKRTPQMENAAVPDARARELLKSLGQPKRVPIRSSRQPAPGQETLAQPVAGMDEPMPPSIDQPSPWRLKPKPDQATPMPGADTQGQNGANDRLPPPGPKSPEEIQAQTIFQQAAATIAQATGGDRYDDPRVDQVAQALRSSLYSPGAVEAQLLTHRYKVTAFGSKREGTIHEETLRRCRDKQIIDQLQQEVAPIEKKLRRHQWFGQRKEALAQRLQNRGALDPRRLSKLATSSLLRRRWRTREVTDYRGRPLVVLAKDGSSSNTLETTFAGKILAAAFLRIERLAKIRLFAADYASDNRGHLVRWLYHPHKTPGRSAIQGAEAVASLPPSGQGSNEDVLSISHIVQEVLKSPLASRQTMIVINITDGKFNSKLEEFQTMIRKLREDYRLTYSLVILGDAPVDGLEVDHMVRIPNIELRNAHQIADRIAAHVHTLVRTLRGKARVPHG